MVFSGLYFNFDSEMHHPCLRWCKFYENEDYNDRTVIAVMCISIKSMQPQSNVCIMSISV